MNRIFIVVISFFLFFVDHTVYSQEEQIPLPEHPRPDFWRSSWINLNGTWEFMFDEGNRGESENWNLAGKTFDRKIQVPFPWGSELSKVSDEADIGWYRRQINIPENWDEKRIFLVVGASDWHSQAWLDGNFLGEHKGGYTPFEFEITELVKPGTEQNLVIRVDDTEHAFKLYGKQGYGNARGIWQTPYLEARGQSHLRYIHFTPDIDNNSISVKGEFAETEKSRKTLILSIKGPGGKMMDTSFDLKKNQDFFSVEFPLNNPKLWTLEDPFLYDVTAAIKTATDTTDKVHTYFGFRKIGVMNVPGTEIPYVALNNKPIYLQMSLDQAYHPEGFYTFPTDEFMRDEIIRSKKIGLNGQRIHVKIGIPRKLYWADKLGMLIMADVPNSWGEPDEDMRREIEYALRQMIRRDYNHPSIFSWVIFNETWGLFTQVNDQRKYLPETQEWVSEMYHLAKDLDPTRLVEDNSACNYDHVTTDLNTWHAYLPGYKWDDMLKEFSEKTFPGSTWNFAEGYEQSSQPNINSECGNVWGYEGSTGDVDWSWDYHLMINAFRKYPKIGGWLYTEHHDVINEWNGYYRFDRSEKFTGLEEFNGMKLLDLHKPVQITPDIELCMDVDPGQTVKVPVWLSIFTGRVPGQSAVLTYWIRWINAIGEEKTGPVTRIPVDLRAWSWGNITPVNIKMPDEPGLAVLYFSLDVPGGVGIHKNFTTFRIRDNEWNSMSGKIFRHTFKPGSFASANWTLKQWDVLDGLKVNGAGSGAYTFRVDIPEEITAKEIKGIIFKFEASAKQLFGKDMENAGELSGDYMRGKGTFDPSRNPNAYPMTDESKFPSLVRVFINDEMVNEEFLQDDPADHRGILSWHAQPEDGKLREAGSYGYLIETVVPDDLVRKIMKDKRIEITLEVPPSYPGGLAIYGKDFGRYPLDPTLLFISE
jgi:hypothetical protein